MKSKRIALTVYLVIFFSCVWMCSDESNIYTPDSYETQIDKLSYQLKYPHIYAAVYSPYAVQLTEVATTEETDTEEKMVYLTFDDGPSPRTAEILDILKKHDVKATFFVVKAKDEYTPHLIRAVEEGHTIGVHSASHKYKEIYASVNAYLDDFTRCYNYIYDNTGYERTIFRFPGGSVNNYNASTRKEIAEEMTRRGYIYFDWNVESNDSSNNTGAQTIYNNVINGCKGKNRAVVIMHDAINKKETVAALDNIITQLKADGWHFAPLTNEVRPVIFRMK